MRSNQRRVGDFAGFQKSALANVSQIDGNAITFQLTHQQAAEAVGRSRAAVSNLLRLLDLPQAIRPLIEKRELEMGHARALLALPAAKQQAEVGALVAKKSLSVRETEALVRRMQSGGGADRHTSGQCPGGR